MESRKNDQVPAGAGRLADAIFTKSSRTGGDPDVQLQEHACLWGSLDEPSIDSNAPSSRRCAINI